MEFLTLCLSVTADILSIIILVYLAVILAHREKKAKKSRLATRFERFKREKIFRNSLLILAVSFIFSFVAVYGSLSGVCGSKLVEASQLISKIFLLIFVIYIVRVLKYGVVEKK